MRKPVTRGHKEEEYGQQQSSASGVSSERLQHDTDLTSGHSPTQSDHAAEYSVGTCDRDGSGERGRYDTAGDDSSCHEEYEEEGNVTEDDRDDADSVVEVGAVNRRVPLQDLRSDREVDSLQKISCLLQKQQEGIMNALSNVCNVLENFQKQCSGDRGDALPRHCRRESVQGRIPRGRPDMDHRLHERDEAEEGHQELREQDFNNHGCVRGDEDLQARTWRRNGDTRHQGVGNYETFQDGIYGGRSQRDRRLGSPRPQAQTQTHSVKIPAFTGKEEWKVWLCRFEAIAKRYNWDDDMKLDQLLPRLQGSAAEFVFAQLPSHIYSSYNELTQELNSRYRVVETAKTFAGKFNRRVQKSGETAEDYAAELKRLYDKAYPNRNRSTRQEDLLRRFIDGLLDEEARFNVEFHKEPEDIDEAVYHVVNFIHTRRGNAFDGYQDRRNRKGTRVAREGSDKETDQDEQEIADRALRVPPSEKGEKGSKIKLTAGKEDSKGQKEVNSELEAVKKEVMDQAKTLKDMQEKLAMLVKSANDRSDKGDKANVTCYSCKQKGHYSRECPTRTTFKRGNVQDEVYRASKRRFDNRGGYSASASSNTNHLN